MGVCHRKSSPRGGGLVTLTVTNPHLAPPMPVWGVVGHNIDRCIIPILTLLVASPVPATRDGVTPFCILADVLLITVTDTNVACTNTPGGFEFTCTCNQGYTGNGVIYVRVSCASILMCRKPCTHTHTQKKTSIIS